MCQVGASIDDGAAEEEVRIDIEDGEAYTREEFIEAYGGTEEWDSAEPVVLPPRAATDAGTIDTCPHSASLMRRASLRSGSGSPSASQSPSRASHNLRTVALERVVRAGFERDSKKLGKLKVGDRFEILESRPEEEGGKNKNRVRFDQGGGGLQGWVSDSSSSSDGLAFDEDIVAALEQVSFHEFILHVYDAILMLCFHTEPDGHCLILVEPCGVACDRTSWR